MVCFARMKPGSPDEEKDADREEPPPFLRNWQRVYATVVIYTVVLILALYVMTLRLNR